jgi:hypothetical protein
MVTLVLALAIVAPMPAMKPLPEKAPLHAAHNTPAADNTDHRAEAEAIHAELVAKSDAPQLLLSAEWWAEQLAQVEQSTEGTETP